MTINESIGMSSDGKSGQGQLQHAGIADTVFQQGAVPQPILDRLPDMPIPDMRH